MADGRDIRYYKLALENVLESAADDGWYLDIDDTDGSLSLVASDDRWALGEQGEEGVDIDVPLQEFEDPYCQDCKKTGVLHNA